MSDRKKLLSPEESQVRVVAVGNSEHNTMAISFSDKLPEAVGITTPQIIDKVKESVVITMALREEKAKLSGSTSVGYSKPYADNWGLVFGNQEDSGSKPN